MAGARSISCYFIDKELFEGMTTSTEEQIIAFCVRHFKYCFIV